MSCCHKPAQSQSATLTHPTQGPTVPAATADARAAACRCSRQLGTRSFNGFPRNPKFLQTALGDTGGPGRAGWLMSQTHLLAPANLHLELPRHVLALLLVLLHLLLRLPHLLLEDIEEVVSLHLCHPGCCCWCGRQCTD